MDNHPDNFGLRLRGHIEKHCTYEKAFADLKVSRSTLYAWFDLDHPPTRQSSLDKLVSFLGSESDYVLHGRASDSDKRMEEAAGTYEGLALGESPNSIIGLRREIHGVVTRLIHRAGPDLPRLGWLLEEIRATERETAHWGVSAEQQAREAAIVAQMKRDRESAEQRQGQGQSAGKTG